jgi:hypothetical protein
MQTEVAWLVYPATTFSNSMRLKRLNIRDVFSAVETVRNCQPRLGAALKGTAFVGAAESGIPALLTRGTVLKKPNSSHGSRASVAIFFDTTNSMSRLTHL